MEREPGTIGLFLCGDVMTGRGIDQVLAHPSDPTLHEAYVRDARDYVALAEAANGPIPKPVDPDYIWGDALAELDRARPQVRVLPLETAITASERWAAKGINYRMHPANIACLAAIAPDVCALANNHVMDWGVQGLADTLDALRAAGIRTAGAGRDRMEAEAPAVVDVPGAGRVLVFAFGHASSGIPSSWGAGTGRPGVNLLRGLDDEDAAAIGRQVRALKRPGDVVIASIHWGGNWGYEVPPEQRRFAHALIDRAGVDVVHGHSSHHAKGIEVYQGHLVLYGCGDFVNDYEGISGYEAYRDDLCFMYLPRVEATTGRLAALQLVPLRIRNFRLRAADETEFQWLQGMLEREGRAFGTRVGREPDGSLRLVWR